MNKCPYCQNELKRGFVEGDARSQLKWAPENISKHPLCRTLSDEDSCIVLTKFGWLNSLSRVEADYCESCKKIIIDIT
jgi:hypothetical protein